MPEKNKTAENVAAALLDIGAIKLSPGKPFIWSSGWRSPIYCDNRLSLSYPSIRSMICDALVAGIRANYPHADTIAGVATAGIPQGALVADRMGLPFVYVRSKPKGHGMENMIEGKISGREKIVLVEDLVSTGGSSLKAAQALQTAGCDILGMAAIFTYGFDLATTNFNEANIPLFCLSNYSVMLGEALKREYLKEKDLASLEKWRASPDTWNAEN